MKAFDTFMRTGILLIALISTLSTGRAQTAAGESRTEHRDKALTEIVVTGERRGTSTLSHIGNVSVLDEEAIRSEAHTHIHELMVAVPGAWISRGSGQENLTSIRSPVLTGAGSCGAFLTLEDGIPTRPSGFCNVNQLFELQVETAAAVEVIRGPGNALYGSNALHGTINVLRPSPEVTSSVAAEMGPNDFGRLTLRAADGESLLFDAVLADDGGFRDDSGYRQYKVHGRYDGEWLGGDLTAAVSLTDLDQETAGFILGEDAYRDDAVNRSNANPEAFRDAGSQRLYAIWQARAGQLDVDVRPFARHSDMRFLQHFLPGQPLEENGHVSAGLNTALTHRWERARVVFGADLEWADVFLKQTQDGPTEGSAFLVETRPAGKHYDYEVRSVSAAPFVQAFLPVSDDVEISAGLRAEYMHYDYDNRMLAGNTRDDGSECGFGGCLYTRPADRSDDFLNIAPKLGIRYAPDDDSSLFLNLSRGFRAPQMTELYRLQNGQRVSDLDSETLDAVEAGFRRIGRGWQAEVVAFVMQKRNSVLRDAEGFNVSAGQSLHRGIEFDLSGRLSRQWSLQLVGTLAKHTYDFDLTANRGETFVSGNDVDTAPRWMGSLALTYAPVERVAASLRVTSLGSYYLDAENRFSYPGHELVDLRLDVDLAARVRLSLRLRNLLDEDFADRADFAFGNFRYFPGRGREVFAEIRYRFSRS